MSVIDFTPRHDQPFTLEQAMMLEIDMLVAGESIIHGPSYPTTDDGN